MERAMENLCLSARLSKVAEWIEDTGNRRVADVGTDHGYLPVYLASSGIADKVIAMDVRKAPLAKAEGNIKAFGVADRVSVRLSDGLDGLEAGEADTITICGMGGRLIRTILERGRGKYGADTQLILSPQSEIKQFRQFLVSEGFTVVREHFLREDNQYYAIMDCRYNPDFELFMRFGRDNLKNRNEDLYQYLKRELAINAKILDTVRKAGASERITQVNEDIYYIRKALVDYYEDDVVTACEGETEGLQQ
jgi:tRNA (adenine22-N1)-methyltransferase